jgi:hypothetical protein
VDGTNTGRVGVVVSPELALVDDELRAAALDSLPAIEPDAFLEHDDRAVAEVGDPVTLRRGVRGLRQRVLYWLVIALVEVIVGLLITYWIAQLH